MAIAIAVISWLLAVRLAYIGWSSTYVDRPLRQAACRGLLPYFGSLALVSTIFVVVDRRISQGGVPHHDLASLLQLEQQIPAWAVFVGELAPPWVALVVAALGLVLVIRVIPDPALTSIGPQTVSVAKHYLSALQWAGAMIGAAGMFTFFGDGVKDRADEVRGQIHSVVVRLRATEDLAVSNLARAVVTEAVRKAVRDADDETQALFQAYSALQAKLFEVDQQRIVRAADRTIQPGQVMRILEEVPYAAPPTDWRPPETEASSDDFRWRPPGVERFPIDRMAQQWQVAGAEAAAGLREDVAKEFMAVGLAGVKDAVFSEPVFAYVFDTLAAAVAEALKASANRSVLEPALNRLWTSMATGSANVSEIARELVGRVDLSRVWHERSREARKQRQSAAIAMRVAATALANGRELPQVSRPLSTEDRRRLLRLMVRLRLDGPAAGLATAYTESERSPSGVHAVDDASLAEAAALSVLAMAAAGKANDAQKRFYDVLQRRALTSAVRNVIPKTAADRWLETHGPIREGGRRPGPRPRGR